MGVKEGAKTLRRKLDATWFSHRSLQCGSSVLNVEAEIGKSQQRATSDAGDSDRLAITSEC